MAESVGSAAVYIFNKDSNTNVRGIEITANHIKSISDGFVYATARPIHRGKTIQYWEIKVVNQKGELISLCKLTTFTMR